MSAQSIFSSTSTIQQYQLVLLCSVFLIQFSLTQIFLLIFLLLFCLTDLILVFEILIKSTIANSYSALCHAFLEKSSVCFISHHVLSSCLRFQPNLFLQAVIWSHAAFLRKIFCLHLQIFNSEAQIFLMFVYNAWKWISQISLAEIW